jgi:hypothetical protein
MIEMRIVLIGDGCRPEFQYRYKLPENEQWVGLKGDLVEWSGWETAPYVSLMETEND